MRVFVGKFREQQCHCLVGRPWGGLDKLTVTATSRPEFAESQLQESDHTLNGRLARVELTPAFRRAERLGIESELVSNSRGAPGKLDVLAELRRFSILDNRLQVVVGVHCDFCREQVTADFDRVIAKRCRQHAE